MILTRIGHASATSFAIGLIFFLVGCGGGPSGTTIYIGPAPTPTPSPTVTNVLVSTSSGAIEELSPVDGSVVSTFATGFGATDLAVDGSGDVFAVSGQNGNGLAEFAIGSNSPTATYAAGSPATRAVVVTPQGELVAASATGNTETIDGWQPGNSGTPNLALQFVAPFVPVFVTPAVRADGTLYVAYESGQNVAYDAYAPGSKTPQRTIVEPRGTAFSPTSMAVAGDGTLYVTEWNRHTDDPFAGLYVYPPTGSERFVHIGAPAPIAVQLDALGNVYVVSDNATSTTPDTVHLFTEFVPGAFGIVRRVTAGFANATGLTVDAKTGLVYLLASPSAKAIAVVERIVPGAVSAAPFAFIDASSLALYGGPER